VEADPVVGAMRSELGARLIPGTVSPTDDREVTQQ
jgi:hypothetical protein